MFMINERVFLSKVIMGTKFMTYLLAITILLSNLLLLTHLNHRINRHTSSLYIQQVSEKPNYVSYLITYFVFEVIDAIITHKDTATINLDTKPSEVDGTFEYSLDDEEFQQCVVLQFTCMHEFLAD